MCLPALTSLGLADNQLGLQTHAVAWRGRNPDLLCRDTETDQDDDAHGVQDDGQHGQAIEEVFLGLGGRLAHQTQQEDHDGDLAGGGADDGEVGRNDGVLEGLDPVVFIGDLHQMLAQAIVDADLDERRADERAQLNEDPVRLVPCERRSMHCRYLPAKKR